MASPRKLTKRSIVHCTYLDDDDIASARSAIAQHPPPPSAYSRFNHLLHSSPAKRSLSLSFKPSTKKHHKGRLSLDATTNRDDDYYHSPLSAPHSPRQSGLASSSRNTTDTARNPVSIPPAQLDVDWDPDYSLDEWLPSSPTTRSVKPKFTIGADQDQEDLGLLSPPSPSSPSDITSNSDEWNPPSHHPTGVRRSWTLSMALMDDSLSDELLIKHLERSVSIPRSSIRVAASPGPSPTTVKFITRITQDLSTSPPTTLYPPLHPLPALSPHTPVSNPGGLQQGSLQGDYRSRPLPPLPIPSSSPPTRDDDAHPSTSHHHSSQSHPRYIIHHPRNGSIHPYHPTFRHALLTVRELIRTEKSYLASLRLLLDYPPPPSTSPHWYGISPGHDDGGEDDSNELSSNSHSQTQSQSHGQHSPSRSTSFAHNNNSYNTQYHPFPQYKSPSPQIPPSHSPLFPSFSHSHAKRQAKYTPPPLMRAYVVELVKVSEALVRKMERDLCVRGVAGAFVGMCDSPPPTISLSSSPTALASSPRPIPTTNPTTVDLNYTSSEFGSWDVLKRDDESWGYGGGGDSYDAPASLENVYVAWCGVVGSWFADRSLGGDGEDSDDDLEEGKRRRKEKERRRKEKSDGGRRLSKNRRLSMLVGGGGGSGGKEELEKARTTPGGPVSSSSDASQSSQQSPIASPTKTAAILGPMPNTTTTTNSTTSTKSEPNSTTTSGKPLTPGMRSKSSTSLKRAMSQWRKSLPSMPSLPGLLGGSGSSSSSSSGGRPTGGGGAMTMSVYEGGPPLPPLPAHLHTQVNGGPRAVGVGGQRLRQQTLPPQLTMTTVNGTVGGSLGGDGGTRKAFEIPGRTSIAFSEYGGGDVSGGTVGGGGKQRRGFELRREAFSEVGHQQQRVMELASPVTTKKSASLCDGGSVGVVVGKGNGNEGREGGGTVTRSKSAVVVRRDAGHGGSHLKERLGGVILGSKVHADGGKMKFAVAAPPVPVAGAVGTGAEEEEEVKPRQRRLPTVRDLAILPTQRVMRYVLLFRDLLAHTPHTSPSREIVEKAVDAAVRVAQKCDRAQGNAAFLRTR